MSFCGTFRQNAPAAAPGTLCSKGCGRAMRARGLCNACYLRAVKAGELEQRTGFNKFTSDRFDGRDDMSGKRCKCGLRKPCNDCLPRTATEYAFTRMHAPSNWPDGDGR